MSKHEMEEEKNNENNEIQRHNRIKSEVSINSNEILLNPTTTNNNIEQAKLEEKQIIEIESQNNVKIINYSIIKSKEKESQIEITTKIENKKEPQKSEAENRYSISKIDKNNLISKATSFFGESQTRSLEERKKDKKWKKKIVKFLDSSPILITMSILTIWALFASDICYAFLSIKVDEAFNIIQCILLGLFSLEFFLTCISKENYICSFFFWLDLISTISLIQDIDYIMNPIMGYGPIKEDKISKNRKRKSAQAAKAISKVSTASRATRVLRVIRIVRLIRMVKLYKSVLIAKERKEKMKLENKKKIMEKLEKEYDDTLSNSKILSENLDKGNNNNESFTNSNSKNATTAVSINKSRTFKRLRERKIHTINKTGESTGGLLIQSNLLLKNGIQNNGNNNSDKNNIKNDKNSNNKEKENGNNEKKDNNKDEDDDNNDENIIKESKISQIITESLTKKVIILILVLLIIFPLLNDDFWQTEVTTTYEFVSQMLSLHYTIFATRGIKDDQINITHLYDKNYPAVNITINGVTFYLNNKWKDFKFRYRELSTVYSDDAMVRIVFSLRKETKLGSLLNLFQTIFVCVALTFSSILFENDANNLVLQPLEIMIEIVEKVAKDPIGAKNIDELQDGIKAEIENINEENHNKNNKNNNNLVNNHNPNIKRRSTGSTFKHDNSNDDNYEVTVIKSAIIKISALLAIGFGDAGGEIIAKNLSNNQDLNPRLKGKKKTAIFGFCDIRQFEEINLALEEKTILFINKIAEIVHSSVDRFKGSTNKNIGESFLNVWKFYNEIKLNEGKPNEKIIKKDNLLEIDPVNPQIGIIADCSVLACLRIILKINKNLDILSYRQNENILKKIPNFKVNMGFGLHMGYGIEGAVGSTYKIDASYLSPNVNIAARLETATRQFKLSILISGVLYDLFTDDMKNICRYVDKVTVKGSELPLDLYTIDLNLNVSRQKESKILIVSNKEKRNIFNEKKLELDALIEECGSVTPIILEKNSYQELIKIRSDDFKDSWNKGIECYKKGDWKNANIYFGTCLKIDPDDGPANVLSNYIKSRNLKAPNNWKGVRELSSK